MEALLGNLSQRKIEMSLGVLTVAAYLFWVVYKKNY